MTNWIVPVAMLLMVAASAAVWWMLPRYQARKARDDASSLGSSLTAKEIAELEDEYRKTLTQALGGIVLLLSAALAFKQLTETQAASERQLKESARATDLSSSQRELASGLELLGNGKSAQHIGGIRILYDWVQSAAFNNISSTDQRYAVVIPALSSFVRDATEFPVTDERCENFRRPLSQQTGSDVQAALDVIRERSRTKPMSLDFRGLNLSRANLAGADLSGSNFAFSDLSEADLSEAKLRNADFYCANLYRAKLDGADLSGDSVDDASRHTNLAGALLLKVNFGQVDGKAASLANAILVRTTMSESFLAGTDLRGARLWEANLFRTVLNRVLIDSNTDLDKSCLVEVKSSDTPLSQAKNYDKAVVAKSGDDLQPSSWCAPHKTTTP